MGRKNNLCCFLTIDQCFSTCFFIVVSKGEKNSPYLDKLVLKIKIFGQVKLSFGGVKNHYNSQDFLPYLELIFAPAEKACDK